jgi:hypothetical protein
MNDERKPDVEIPEDMKLVKAQVPVEEQEAEKKEPTLEDGFPLKDFHDTIIVLFKHAIQGGPVSLKIVGNSWLAGEIMKGGRHEVNGENGHAIVFNGNDILWAECVTAQENRQRAIAHAKAQLAAEEAKALEEKLAQGRAAMDKAEAALEAKAALEAAKVKKPRGFLAWLKGDDWRR